MASPPRPVVSHLDTAIELLLAALLVFMPWARGAVWAWSEMVAISSGAAIALLLAVRWILSPEDRLGPRAAWIVIGLFLLLCVVQLIPLPASLIKSISTGTHELKTELLSDLPDAENVLARMTLSFYALGTRHDLRIVLLAITILAAVLTISRHPQRRTRLLLVMTLIGASLALHALLQKLEGVPRPSSTFANYSHFGQTMNLTIGAALALLLMSWRRWTTPILLAAFICLGLATIAFSSTRGGVIAAGVAGSFTLLALACRRRRYVVAAILMLVLGASVAAGFKIGLDHTRAQINRDVLIMAREFPLAGTGLGTFMWTYPMFDRTNAASIAEFTDNEYAQMLAETGWVGICIILIFVGVIGWYWLRALQREDRNTLAIALGMGYGVLAVMVHSVTDFGQHLASLACMSALACGLIVNAAGEREPSSRPRRAWRIALAIAMVGVATWAMLGATRAWRAEAAWYGDRKDLDQQRACAEAAVAAEPQSAHYRYWFAVRSWQVAVRDLEDDTPELQAAARNAVEQLNIARRLAPTYGAVYSVLGQIELTFLKLPIGAKRIETAAKLDPNDPTAWFATGRVDARRGDFIVANEKFRRSLMLDYTVLDDILELYLDELKMPEPAIKLGELDWSLMCRIGNGMMSRPEFQKLGGETFRRGQYMLADAARRDGGAAYLASAGRAMLECEENEAAEEFYAAALRQDPSQTDWHAGRAHVLLDLERLNDAAEEIRTVEQQQPDHPQLASLKQRLEELRNTK